MAELKSIRLEKHQIDAIEDMEERGDADTQTEAHKRLLNAGLREFGYFNGEYTDTALKSIVGQLSTYMLVAGVVWTGLTWYYPRVYAMPAIGLFLSGLFLGGVERALQDYEPRVTNKLKAMFGRKA